MQKSQIDSATLAAVMLAAALALLLLTGPLAWLASIAGFILLFVLFSYDQEGYRSLFQSLAFSAVCGFCVAVAAGVLFQLMAAKGEVHLANGGWSGKWLPLTWVFATVIIWAIDRARMGNREPVELREARRRVARPEGFIPRSTPVSTAAAEEEPAAEPAVRVSEAVAPIRPAERVEEPTPAPRPVELPPPTGTADAVLVRPGNHVRTGGKETDIYVALVGEGLNMLRSVRAEHVGRDFYRIIEEVPTGESWEYQPGQVVRCKKKNLSSGKAWVAVEEAPRAQ